MRYSVEYQGPYGKIIGFFYDLADAHKACKLFGDNYRVWDNQDKKWC